MAAPRPARAQNARACARTRGLRAGAASAQHALSTHAPIHTCTRARLYACTACAGTHTRARARARTRTQSQQLKARPGRAAWEAAPVFFRNVAAVDAEISELRAGDFRARVEAAVALKQQGNALVDEVGGTAATCAPASAYGRAVLRVHAMTPAPGCSPCAGCPVGGAALHARLQHLCVV